MREATELVSVWDFKEALWSGARDTLDELTMDETETLMHILEQDPYTWDLTELNDFVWFERDTIAKWLGYEDFEAIMRRNRNE